MKLTGHKGKDGVCRTSDTFALTERSGVERVWFKINELKSLPLWVLEPEGPLDTLVQGPFSVPKFFPRGLTHPLL